MKSINAMIRKIVNATNPNPMIPPKMEATLASFLDGTEGKTVVAPD